MVAVSGSFQDRETSVHTHRVPEGLRHDFIRYFSGEIALEGLRLRVLDAVVDDAAAGDALEAFLRGARRTGRLAAADFNVLSRALADARPPDNTAPLESDVDTFVDLSGPPVTEVAEPVGSAGNAPLQAPSTLLAAPTPKRRRSIVVNPAAPLVRGEILLERYAILGRAKTGGTGLVYQAVDRHRETMGTDHPQVAIKVSNTADTNVSLANQALEYEFECLLRLTHPGIVRAFDFGRHGDLDFLVLEWLGGRTLRREQVGSDRLLPRTADAVRALVSVTEALAHAHREGIVHADIKPSNVFVTDEGSLKLIDFGNARNKNARHSRFRRKYWATRAYASCEVLEMSEPEPADDVFSLACLGWELLAGQRAFGEFDALAAEQRGLTVQPFEGIPPEIQTALRRALSFRRENRPSDAGELLDALRRKPPTDTTLPQSRRRAVPGWPPVVAAALAGFIAGSIVFDRSLPVNADVAVQPDAGPKASDDALAAPFRVTPEWLTERDVALPVARPDPISRAATPVITAERPSAAPPTNDVSPGETARVDDGFSTPVEAPSVAMSRPEDNSSEPPATGANLSPFDSDKAWLSSVKQLPAVSLSSVTFEDFVKPDYPSAALRRGLQGWVRLSFAIAPSGEPIGIEIIDGTGEPLLDRSAVAAAKRWRFSDTDAGKHVTARLSFEL